MTILNIIPVAEPGLGKTGELVNMTAKQIEAKLGFAPNVEDDPAKVTASWGFMLNPEPDKTVPKCGIWDYKGSGRFGVWSTYGPRQVFVAIFGEENVG